MTTGAGSLRRLLSVADGSSRRRTKARGLACLLALVLVLGSPRPATAGDDEPEQARFHLRMESAASSLDNRAETVEQASFLATSHANLPVLGLDSRRENSARGAPVVGGTAPLRLAQVSPSGPPSTPVVVSVNCPRAAEPAQPSYWPLWVALGLVVAAGVVVGVMYARENADLTMPITTFGAKRF